MRRCLPPRAAHAGSGRPGAAAAPQEDQQRQEAEKTEIRETAQEAVLAPPRGERAERAEDREALVEEAERSCARLSALVGEMSELSHLDSGEVSPAGDTVEVAGMLDEVVASVEEGRDRDVRAVRAGSSDPVAVAADRRLLGESLRAILTAVLREQSEPGSVVPANSGQMPASISGMSSLRNRSSMIRWRDPDWPMQ